MANTPSSLKNHFLLAMPGLSDPNFKHAVIYLCEHSTEEGAMGLTINHPTDVPMSRLFDAFDLSYPEELGKRALLSGGPVQQERGFVIHRPGEITWETTVNISPDICITASRDVIEDIARNRGPKSNEITLGYSGWAPGQLEQEIAENSWLVVAADPDIIFDIPFEQRAAAAAAKLGITLDKLSPHSGHA